MAVSISNAFVTLFDSEVKQAYQGQRALAGLTRERTVEGSTVKFPKIGKGTASIRVPQPIARLQRLWKTMLQQNTVTYSIKLK